MSPTEQVPSAEQLAALRSDVRHIQSDITEIKGDVRTASQRMDALRVELSARIESTDNKLTDRIDRLNGKIDGKIDEVNAKIDSKIDGLNAKIDSKVDGVNGKIDGIRVELTEIRKSVSSAKVWALILYGTLFASILTIVGRAFKWF